MSPLCLYFLLFPFFEVKESSLDYNASFLCLAVIWRHFSKTETILGETVHSHGWTKSACDRFARVISSVQLVVNWVTEKKLIRQLLPCSHFCIFAAWKLKFSLCFCLVREDSSMLCEIDVAVLYMIASLLYRRASWLHHDSVVFHPFMISCTVFHPFLISCTRRVYHSSVHRRLSPGLRAFVVTKR